MSTALDIIKRSMRLIGALGSDETPSAAEQTDGLAALNALLESWSTQRLTVFRVEQVSITWPASTASRTIGASGADVTASRPIDIVSAYQTQSSIDYPITILTQSEWDNIIDKGTESSIVEHLWYDATMANGTLYAWPVPSGSATIKIRAHAQFTAFSAATTAVNLPPGYERALAYNLAIDLSAEYQRDIPASVIRIANSSLSNLRRINHKTPRAANEIGSVAGSGAGAFNWNTGE